MVDISHPLAQQAADLVNEIERFPASDQQTRCVTMAAKLVASISAFCAPRQGEPGGIWDVVERAAARVPPWVGLPAQQAKSLLLAAGGQPPERGPDDWLDRVLNDQALREAAVKASRQVGNCPVRSESHIDAHEDRRVMSILSVFVAALRAAERGVSAVPPNQEK